jgi:hypothetical protein
VSEAVGDDAELFLTVADDFSGHIASAEAVADEFDAAGDGTQGISVRP